MSATKFGRTVLATYGREVHVTATDDAEYKVGGVTLDWDLINAVSGSAATLDDGTIVPVGYKYIRYGTPLAMVTNTGLYAPADSTANNGLQTWTAGRFFVLDTTVLENTPGQLGRVVDPDHPPVIDGGTVYAARMNVGGAGQPTLAQVLAVLPRLKVLEDI